MAEQGKGKSRADLNRKVRQEAMRDQIANQNHLKFIVRNILKIEDLDKEMEANELQRLKTANESRLKLLNKYLPDLKSTELSGPDGGPIEATTNWVVQPVKAVNETNSEG